MNTAPNHPLSPRERRAPARPDSATPPPPALRPLPTILCLLTTVLWLTGCSLVPEPKADPTRHYILTTPDDSASGLTTRTTDTRETTKGKPAVAIHAIDMPAYLRARKNITLRLGANEIVYHEYARWAETLEDGVTRILCESLLASESVSSIAPLPGRAMRDYDLLVRVIECEGVIPSEGGAPAIRFSAEYEIAIPGGAAMVGTRTFVAPPLTWDGKDYSALATLLGRSVAALADDIAKNLPAQK